MQGQAIAIGQPLPYSPGNTREKKQLRRLPIMKNPLESIQATIAAGIALAVVLNLVATLIV
jgi:hypothetical protein